MFIGNLGELVGALSKLSSVCLNIKQGEGKHIDFRRFVFIVKADFFTHQWCVKYLVAVYQKHLRGGGSQGSENLYESYQEI